MDYLKAFIIGGIICVIGQLLLDGTKLTPAHVLVAFVTSGAILGALGIYEPIVDFGGTGATIPLTGFGYSLSKGAIDSVKSQGLIGAFTGGIQSTAGGVAAAVVFGYIMAVIFNPKSKK
ncbi:stage V sporulation protein AE [Maledivibacter halophilus]|uniref:Stage V sporulation protein AE n=1 Tax=Maledivibacter halophilus TaxID=36842 RepID=A0A1T5MTF7_9FIRM|nr:stage V sporulation protein AE [Maledivibacter halophilus]SKC91495.1 stage V sporulation protein AE [Maledivibacter halophilus]